ncbi:MAG TPA: FAD-dependent monooxygenase [Enterovirga sp.]|nr:FAD-dependent monooxygenase [Enterovirga sp.]
MPSQIERAASPPAWHILIAGGGAPGLSLALALTEALGSAVRVTVADPGFLSPRQDSRAFAVSPAAMRMLDALGVWAEIRLRAQPILGMTITDSRLDDPIRPDYLKFQGDDEPLGHMVEADGLGRILQRRCREAGIALAPDRIASFTAADQFITTRTADGTSQDAVLLVAADGARSRLRDEAGISWMGRRYDQSGIVATIAHERDHGAAAVQHFLPSGPFAILPLVPADGELRYRSSLVWTERAGNVPALLAAGREAAQHEVERRAGPELGRIALVSELRAHPLGQGRARRSVGPRFALLGDAAHEIHPLAGQGLNLGLGDAAALAERIVDAVRLGLDPGSAAVLDGYDRNRRAATLAMTAITDALNGLFSNESLQLRVLRDLGLGLVDRTPGLKRIFIEGASGGTGSPRLMRGERL